MEETIRQLTQAQRLNALEQAKKDFERVLGPRPKPEQFKNYHVRSYPNSVLLIVISIMFLFLSAAWAISAMRLYDIARNVFFQSINHDISASVAGAAIVLLAEIGQVGFTLSLVILSEDASRASKISLWLAAIACTAIALVGNFEKGLWGRDQVTPFAVIETLFPPILVLISAYVLKEVVLSGIAQYHANIKAYQQAVANWELGMNRAEQHSEWPRIYANAILAELRRRNNSKGAQAFWQTATDDDYRRLIERELRADQWYVRIEKPAQPQLRAPSGDQHVNNAQYRQNEDGEWIAICPQCHHEMVPKADQIRAKRALSAHMKSHANLNGGQP